MVKDLPGFSYAPAAVPFPYSLAYMKDQAVFQEDYYIRLLVVLTRQC